MNKVWVWIKQFPYGEAICWVTATMLAAAQKEAFCAIAVAAAIGIRATRLPSKDTSNDA